MENTAAAYQSACYETEKESHEIEAGSVLAEKLERKNLILCRGRLNNKKDAMDQTF